MVEARRAGSRVRDPRSVVGSRPFGPVVVGGGEPTIESRRFAAPVVTVFDPATELLADPTLPSPPREVTAVPQPTPSIPLDSQQRQQWRIQGQVQGVGFRPFVFRLAQTYGLTGSVRNEDSAVVIEAQGPAAQLAAFAQALQSGPAMSRVDRILTSSLDTVASTGNFQIVASTTSVLTPLETNVTPDLALCPDCRRELLAGPGQHRLAGYPLINCTHCGPRYSIIRRTPYDRSNTTMAQFPMCQQCRGEYDDPAHRRFHAQPIACAACGPHVRLVTHLGEPVAGDPIVAAMRLLAAGQILALKGLGGYHLAVRATDHAAVARLRQLKQRDAKPFAIMCQSLAEAQLLVDLSDSGAAALISPATPIVLAPHRPNHGLAPAIAPGSHRLGVMLPYTPLQHLLFAHEQGGRELGPLVMTSANYSDEPLIFDDADALQRLGGLCDALLLHDRPIQRPVDDSIVLDLAAETLLPIRRARGYVPVPISLPESLRQAPAGLCLGGELKNTIAVVTHGQAILSQHLGDLRHPRSFSLFQQTIRDLLALFAVQPRWIAHDLHLLYLSTQYAKTLAQEWNIPLLPVPHHHAHAAALLAENQLEGPILAIVCDGTGYGVDETIWGGELLLADVQGFRRLAHLRPLLLPGGDAASIDTRRPALAALAQAFGPDFVKLEMTKRLFPDSQERDFILQAMAAGINTTPSTGAGRYFDAVASLLGVCMRNDYEGQAGQMLEAVASGHAAKVVPTPSSAVRNGQIDLAPLLGEVVQRYEHGQPVGPIAAYFHDQFADIWATVATQAIARTGVRTIGLSGGVFCNQRLTRRLTETLSRLVGVRVLRHRLVPPNDGGIALGQAALGAAQSMIR